MTVRKPIAKPANPAKPTKRAKQAPQVQQPRSIQKASYDSAANSIIWDLGRAYFAYVGLLERVLAEQELDHILRPGMGVVLFALYDKDKVSIKNLAERSQLACSTLTGVLQRMEDAGLITRTRDSQDGRLVRVALTSLGRKLEGKCREVAQQMTDVSGKGVGLANTQICSKFLQGLTATYRLEEQRLSIERPRG